MIDQIISRDCNTAADIVECLIVQGRNDALASKIKAYNSQASIESYAWLIACIKIETKEA